VSCVPNGIQQSDDGKFKLMVINYAVQANNCKRKRNFSVVEAKA
jgi:hypothetical protein